MRTTDLSLLWKLRKRKSKPHYRTKGRVPKWGVVWLTGCWLLAGAEVAHADFFKWEVLVYPEGWGTAYVTFPVTNEGVVYKNGFQVVVPRRGVLDTHRKRTAPGEQDPALRARQHRAYRPGDLHRQQPESALQHHQGGLRLFSQ